MKVTYIHHDSFSVEFNKAILLFDYFQGKLPDFDKNKKLYVFASHSHSDHFSSVIFDLRSKYKNIKYILSDDIKVTKEKDIYFVKENEIVYIDDLKIETLKSTDLGVAFIITVEGKTIYHAGDLNWWHWEGEIDSENKKMEKMYKHEIEKIKNRDFDIAFVPLDSRQGKYFYLGFDEFMRNTNTKLAFPMHCWGDYSLVDKLSKMEESKDYKDRIIHINEINREFDIK